LALKITWHGAIIGRAGIGRAGIMIYIYTALATSSCSKSMIFFTDTPGAFPPQTLASRVYSPIRTESLSVWSIWYSHHFFPFQS
jgi:hypothetical protein